MKKKHLTLINNAEKEIRTKHYKRNVLVKKEEIEHIQNKDLQNGIFV